MPPTTEERLAQLEVHGLYSRRDITEIKQAVSNLSAQMSNQSDQMREIPTRADWRSFRAWEIGISVAVAAAVVAAIIGGLSWIKPESSPPAPIIIQAPAQAPSAAKP